ncbi:hypothetical protein [Klenkia brasiliensis]|uniref:Uncharacterized protein n=1 Tax=Klenkia brasiliensis TaxID=333142 RepID=A0A1G7TJX8_9ACTN|nr:hypothetical protein [Klenkia brasiliensis]SDG35636.1 hypothetical protein SAMN05660324_2510 [Klenkia brasiliensis]
MANPLFSSYSGGENRVTSSMVAVFERIDLSLVQELLRAATGADNTISGVTFANQIVKGESVPDARISAHFDWWFETKTVRGAYANDGHGRKQLRQHSKLLLEDASSLLLALTPDPVMPGWFNELDDVDSAAKGRVHWLNFAGLADAISTVLSDDTRLVGEQTRFLLTELVAFFESEGLLAHDDVVVIAAKSAWPEFAKITAYVCQPNRSFRSGLTHMAFYADGQIKPVVPAIERHFRAVNFSDQNVQSLRAAGESRLAGVVEALLLDGSRTPGAHYDVFLLSSKESSATLILESPIENDSFAPSGKRTAWVQGQRYTSASRLTSGAEFTSEL